MRRYTGFVAAVLLVSGGLGTIVMTNMGRLAVISSVVQRMYKALCATKQFFGCSPKKLVESAIVFLLDLVKQRQTNPKWLRPEEELCLAGRSAYSCSEGLCGNDLMLRYHQSKSRYDVALGGLQNSFQVAMGHVRGRLNVGTR